MIQIETSIRGKHRAWQISDLALEDQELFNQEMLPLFHYLEGELDRDRDGFKVLWDADGHPFNQIERAILEIMEEDRPRIDLVVALDQEEEIRVEVKEREMALEFDAPSGRRRKHGM